tara:strand:- start:655 stop:885 length:231 start_codon:yes stop_codon:yes gene_type:complete
MYTDKILDMADQNNGFVPLKELANGAMFKRKPMAKTVFTKGDYWRPDQVYGCQDYEDVGREVFLKGATKVFINFEY